MYHTHSALQLHPEAPGSARIQGAGSKDPLQSLAFVSNGYQPLAPHSVCSARTASALQAA
jgi:hypothetical protein